MSKKEKQINPDGLKFSSVAALEDHLRNRKITLWENIMIEIRYIWEKITDIPRAIGYAIQRLMRGWSDEDLWGMHVYLTNTILCMLVELKATTHTDDKEFLSALDEMIDGFAVLRKCDVGQELEWGGYYLDDDARKIGEKHFQKWGMRLTTKEEERKVKRAFELLAKHYHSLWD